MSDDYTADRVFACGCIEESRPISAPPGWEPQEGVEWTDAWVTTCGNPDTCQHPIVVANREGNIFQADEIVWEGE